MQLAFNIEDDLGLLEAFTPAIGLCQTIMRKSRHEMAEKEGGWN